LYIQLNPILLFFLAPKLWKKKFISAQTRGINAENQNNYDKDKLQTGHASHIFHIFNNCHIIVRILFHLYQVEIYVMY
jgi:hypothetical protein